LCGGSAYADSPKAPIAKHVVLIGFRVLCSAGLR
jgi:hypothetical protein